MNTTILTREAAVAAFYVISGDESMDADEIAEAVAEIGSDGQRLHIVETSETVEDYLANGWERDERNDHDGVMAVRKKTGQRSTRRGWVNTYACANIADCGDKRLVYVERQ